MHLTSYLLIGLRNQAGDAAVSIQEVLKLLVTDDEPLCLSQGCLSCVLPINQQALEHLNTGSADGKDEDEDMHTADTDVTFSPCLCSPSSGRGSAPRCAPSCLRHC